LAIDEDHCGIALVDVSTGEFLTAEGSLEYIDKLIQGLKPAEIIYSKAKRESFHLHFQDQNNPRQDFTSFALEDWIFAKDYCYEKLMQHFKTKTLKGFGLGSMTLAIIAAGTILHYLDETEHKDISHISTIGRIDEEEYVWLDKFTIRNLELISPQQEGGVPLIDIMDHTLTPMGARLMKRWVVLPLQKLEIIEERLSVVEALVKDPELKDQLEEYLEPVGDLERLISKVAVGRINPREMQQLKRSLQQVGPSKELLKNSDQKILKTYSGKLEECGELIELIENQLKEDVPLLSNQGGIIAEGINEELDELRKIAFSGKDYLLQIQKRETERTGISSLKIAYNKVFGYYLEVTHVHKDKVPEEWIRKQTLVNAERYITPELKEYEDKILSAEEKIISIEQTLYLQLLEEAMGYVGVVQQNARIIAFLDSLLSFASLALKNKYVKPKINDSLSINIKEGRHPVIEKQLPVGEEYIPNDVFLDNEEQQIMIITGPNMAGKSALLRQTALIVLMAQMGSFVPAKSAELGVIDKVFTRVGASDNLSLGESTFMVEMTETASILNNLSDRSLILMDEIGRGTSTYDGISIAWSIVEFLHNHMKYRAKTLFATHYHEMNQLTNDFERIRNFNVSVKEVGDNVIFLRKLVKGGSEHSFGIHVAQMAGMPNQVVIRANEIMSHLEKDKLSKYTREKLKEVPTNNFQLSMFTSDPAFEEVKGLLEALDINTISPVEALLKLNEIKMKLGK